MLFHPQFLRTLATGLAVAALALDLGAQETARLVCNFQDKHIDEASGLAASRLYPGLLWTHKDSLNPADLFLVNGSGQTVLTYHVNGAENFDWEDMAIAGGGSQAWVYVGDIGDNFGIRAQVQIYRMREPSIEPERVGQAQPAVNVEKMTLAYPDGAHDAETLLATKEGRLVILTKEPKAHLYATPQPFRKGTQQTLVRLRDVEFSEGDRKSVISGGDLAPDGSKVALVSLRKLYEWKLKAPGDLSSDPPERTERDLPKLRQCEAVCYSLDGKSLYVTSEGEGAPIYQLPSSFAATPAP